MRYSLMYYEGTLTYHIISLMNIQLTDVSNKTPIQLRIINNNYIRCIRALTDRTFVTAFRTLQVLLYSSYYNLYANPDDSRPSADFVASTYVRIIVIYIYRIQNNTF